MKNKNMMKRIFWILTVTLLTFTSCSLPDNPATDIPTEDHVNIVAQWITEYAEEGFDPLFETPYNRVVEIYEFFDDGTGYYERYQFYDEHLVNVEIDRGETGLFTYTTSGKQVTITLDYWPDEPWQLTYSDNTLIDQQGHQFLQSTEEQRKQVLEWFTAWWGGSADDENTTSTPITEDFANEPANARSRK